MVPLIFVKAFDASSSTSFHKRAGLLSAANVVLLDPETQFSTIMSSENTTVIRCLAEFIMNANKLRDSLESAT